jgi:hypothetical protein
MKKSRIIFLLKSNLKPQEAFRSITRSIIWVCGSSFLLILSLFIYKFYLNQRLSGFSHSITTKALSKQEISKLYWQQLISQLDINDRLLGPEQLELIRKFLIDTGYFRHIEVECITADHLEIRYDLSQEIAVIANTSIYLYDTKKLLPCRSPENLKKVPQIYLGPYSSVREFYDQKIDIASFILQNFSQNFENYQLVNLDVSEWLNKDRFSSQVSLLIQDSNQQKIWLRVGSSYAYNSNFWKSPILRNMIAESINKRAAWIDARVERLIVIGNEA